MIVRVAEVHRNPFTVTTSGAPSASVVWTRNGVFSPTSDPRHGELDDVRPASVEPVEAGRGFVADGSRRPEAEQAAHLAALDRVR